ncbi:hypothetical protein JL720_6447 [Aureococcus anophagefferens]|nr:hypothetical protein JL720_6447 [Aureococcus anophagefferens]
MFVAPRQKPTWSECRPWRDVRVRRCGSCGLRLLQRLDPAPVVCATLLVVEVPESVVLEELLESLECRDTWHAKGHYAATRHGFALELETGRIWDYVEDRYAHRVDDDDVAASGAPCGGCGPAAPADRKFGALADHYERILEAQLAEQRAHYERLAARTPGPRRSRRRRSAPAPSTTRGGGSTTPGPTPPR